MNATHTTTTAVTATVDTQISDLIADLTGFHPALDRAIAAIGDLVTADLTADQSQSVIAALGGFQDGNAVTLLALAVRRIADPTTNPALADLPDDSKRTLRRLGAEYTAQVDDCSDIASEISGVIDGA